MHEKLDGQFDVGTAITAPTTGCGEAAHDCQDTT